MRDGQRTLQPPVRGIRLPLRNVGGRPFLFWACPAAGGAPCAKSRRPAGRYPSHGAAGWRCAPGEERQGRLPQAPALGSMTVLLHRPF